ncbi:MAG: SDR family NAD(P)-dependent oxidoreductase, partial [Chloroflexota bacterium]
MATVMITGATDGIGYALAKLYAARGDRLILVGRRALDTLDDPFFTPDNYCRTDLAEPDAPEHITAFLTEHSIATLDLVIHNAGVGFVGELTEQTSENVMTLVNVNFRAPVMVTHALIDQLRGGRVAFVSSVATAMPAPDYAVYNAAKSALDGFVTNLRTELHPYDIGVTLIHPGATRTGMHAKANYQGDTSKFTSPAEVAAAIQRTLDAENDAAVIGFVNKALRFVGTTFAGAVDTAMRRSNIRTAH